MTKKQCNVLIDTYELDLYDRAELEEHNPTLLDAIDALLAYRDWANTVDE